MSSAVQIGTAEPGSTEWHELRAGGIGGSEIAAVVGLSPYMSAFYLWHLKKGNLAKQEKSWFSWGHRLEPVVREWFQERHPELWVHETPGTFAHEGRPWQRVNPDGLISEAVVVGTLDAACTSLLEIKTSRYGEGFGPSGSDEIPLDYRCQIQWALDIFDLPRAYVAVLIGGNEPREYVIEADPGDQEVLRGAGQLFWESLQENDEPPIDMSDSTYEAVRKLHPEIDPDAEVEIDPEMWTRYLLFRESIAAEEGELQEMKSRILAAMGVARIAKANGTPVLRRQMSSAGTPYLKEIA